MKVSLFITCLCDIFTPEVGKHTVEILEKSGCEVDFPEGQTCCGQPAFNSGYLKDSKQAMIQMIQAFQYSDYVVGPSGSCVGMIKEYPKALANDSQWKEPAKKLASKTFELTQFLVDVLHITDVGSQFRGKVTYHPSCHMTRILGVKDAPVTLLKKIPGVDLEELQNKEDCCGFGGTFAIKNAAISTEMVKEKSRHISNTEAAYLVGGDMACLMNIQGRMQREGKEIKVVHIAEILNCNESQVKS
ncbi:(Fe-S)-binding protein [Virgibacillus sp. W0181]|uniref:(Fe-S)-binding protein n=1 Tax=Virgibacillus sp. W0181 TaxID=3391581 RepID=UPI003F44C3B6